MNKLTFTKTLLPLCIAATISIPVQADDIYANHGSPQLEKVSTKETGGFGIGLIVGAILGGPPGAVVGAAGGSWLGHHDTQHTNTIAAIDSELGEKEKQITKLETELSVTEIELANTIRRFEKEQRLATLEFLSKRQTTTIYFGSGEVDMPSRSGDRLYELAQLLNDYPELQINMEGHTDIQGNDEYNQHLSELRVDTVQNILEEAGIPADRVHCQSYGESQAMATEGDDQNYVFDRRVSIHVSLDSAS